MTTFLIAFVISLACNLGIRYLLHRGIALFVATPITMLMLLGITKAPTASVGVGVAFIVSIAVMVVIQRKRKKLPIDTTI